MEKITILNDFNSLVQARSGLFIANRHDFYLGYALIRYGEYGEAEWNLLKQLIQQGSTVVEVGANIGTHTISIARAVGNKGRVIAIEPQRVIFQYLCANIALNGIMNVDAIQCGCGSSSGSLTVPAIDYAASAPQNFGGVSLQKDGSGEPVAIRSIDDLVGERKDIHLIKIDVEGMEADVIRGAIVTIRENRPTLYVENDRVEKSEELIGLLQSLDYRLYWHIPPLFNPDNFFEETENLYGNIASYNMLCLPKESSMEVGSLQMIEDPSDHPLVRSRLPIDNKIDEASRHYDAGQFLLAEILYRQVLEDKHDSPELFKDYGNTLLSLGRLQEAESAYLKAIELKSDYAAAFNNLGNVLRLDGRLKESELAFIEAVRFLPDNPEIHNNFGTLLMDLGQFDRAENLFRRAIVLKPDFIVAYLNRCSALRSQMRLPLAEKCCRQALKLAPDYAEAHIVLGQILLQSGDPDEAEKSFLQALYLQPGSFEAYNDLGNTFLAKGSLEDAERAYDNALAIRPSYAPSLFNLSQINLLKGNFEQGLTRYENRFGGANPDSFRATNAQLSLLKDNAFWQGEQADGRTLLVITEQGAGDSIMMMRYLPLLKQRGFERIRIYCEPELKRLFASISVVDDVISKEEPLPVSGFDCFCTIMSFPFLFQTRLTCIPADVPYLHAPDADRSKWRSQLAGISAAKVGVVWAGSNYNLADKKRSIPLSSMSPLACGSGVQLISLQKGRQSDNIQEHEIDMIDWMEMCDDFMDTAALITELDLVISVDTAIAHLAGALGKKVWLLCRFESEWRWMLDREDSPWYPTMRIFRQEARDEWGPVIKLVAAELMKLT